MGPTTNDIKEGLPFPRPSRHEGLDQDQGQGPTTEFKLRGIQSAISVTMRVATGLQQARFPYWHIDLNSGSGINARAGCIGSPLAFLQAADTLKPNYRATFCDIRADAIRELKERVGANPRCECHCGNNRDVLPIVADRIRRAERNPHFAMGTVICDPNGYFYGGQVPANAMAAFCREFPRIDVILNLNVRTRRLIRGCVEKRRAGWEDVKCLALDEIPSFLNRKHWLIRNLISKGGDQFVLMIGRNYRLGDHRAMGFHHMESKQGQSILAAVEGCRIHLEEAV